MNEDKELASDPEFETVCNERRDAAIQRMEQDSELAAIDATRAVTSIILKGDVSLLTPTELARYYLSLCDTFGLDYKLQPFDLIETGGKKRLYANRCTTDALAAKYKVTRETVERPHVEEFGGSKVIICVARATMPDGRSETATATVPFADIVNGLMKCETKAKRRATLAILGLGLLDHTELETIPGVRLPVAPQSSEEVPTIVRDPLDVAEDTVRAIRDDNSLSRADKMNRWSALITSTSVATRSTTKMSPEAVARELTRRLK